MLAAMRTQYPLIRVTALSLGLFVVTSSVAWADKDDDKKEKTERRGRKKQSSNEASIERQYTKEIEKLAEAEPIVDSAKDEKSAKDAAKQLIKMFDPMPVLIGGNDIQLDKLARAQNKINIRMEKIKKEPWFVPSGMQEAWGLITVHSFRRRASNKN